MQETWFDPWVRKISWRRKWQPTPGLLPGKSHGWRSLVGYNPWSRKEVVTTERLFFLSSFFPPSLPPFPSFFLSHPSLATGKTIALTRLTFVGKVMSLLFNMLSAAAAAKSLQSCPSLCDAIDGSPPGSPVPGILQARTLEWVAISFSNAWKWKVKVKLLSRVWLVATPWTAAHQASLSMAFSRQEYWSGVPLPSPLICFLGWS